jgi:hypothetical protein
MDYTRGYGVLKHEHVNKFICACSYEVNFEYIKS